MSPDTSTFGEILRSLRTAASLSQETLAERAGLSLRGISDLERGARQTPRFTTVRLLADALALGPDDRQALVTAARPDKPTGKANGGVTVSSGLPAPLTAFIGRERELDDLTALFGRADVRLMTLTGPGGTGKTRLALALAEWLTRDFPDGATFVDLAPLGDHRRVPAEIAGALGLQETSGISLSDVTGTYLAERRHLLLLDNFEHLLDAAPVVADLLSAGPRVKVLVTSRERLRLRGEREYAVPPFRLPMTEEMRDPTRLAMNEAVAFFVDRARAVHPDFTLEAENAPAVAAICQRLDGLPLALELAAARVKLLPPATLLARLDARLPLLSSGMRDAPHRQRTLRDAIAWSHDLLTQEEAQLFRRLGVFTGGWTLEAAEWVAGSPALRSPDTPPPHHPTTLSVLEGLASLKDKSLVRLHESDSEPRYGMLETIREFAQERLAASGEEASFRESHASYFLRLAEQARPHLYGGAEQRIWLQRLEADNPNFRVALETLAGSNDDETYLRLAANLGYFWFIRADITEGRVYLERALARAVVPTRHRADALKCLGELASSQDDFPAAKTPLRQSEELARALDAPEILWEALFLQGRVADLEGDDDRAMTLYQSGLAVARDLHDPQAVGVVLTHLSDAAYRMGDLEAAARFDEEAVTLLRAAGDEFNLGLGIGNIGQVAVARGDTCRAVAAYEEALEIALRIDVVWIISSVLAGFAAVAAARGDFIGAAQLLGATDAVLEASHRPRIPHHFQHAQTIPAVRGALSEAAFAAAWDAGRLLSTEEAIALPHALGLTEWTPTYCPAP